MAFKVFISHSVEDLDLVYQLKYWLELNGVQAYVAELSPQYGVNLSDKIATAINWSDCVLALMTKHGIRSQWVHDEVGHAYGKRLIVPIVEEGEENALKGFIKGGEYIRFRRDDPYDALNQAVNYLAFLKADKEQKERNEMIAAATLTFLALLFLAALSGKK